MPVSAIVVTAGAADANAYVSLAAADQYHLDRPADAAGTWTSATTSQRTAAILWATKLLDSMYEWSGAVVTSTQALLWPRGGMVYPSGYSVPTTVIPVQLQQACAEFARQLLAGDRAADNDIEAQGITGITAGPIELTFSGTAAARVVPDAVSNLIPDSWGIVKGRDSATRKLVRA